MSSKGKGSEKRSKLLKKLRSGLKFAFSKKAIPSLKGVLAYTLAFVLAFLYGFERLSPYPLALSSMIIVVIAGQPGKTVGACIQNTFLALCGVLIGALNFFILAKLGHVTVAQGFVFALMIYCLALIKAISLKYLGFALLAILMTFNGIYTSLLNNGEFSPAYLKAYLEAYAWAAAIVLFVNIFVFPQSSEAELRKMLVVSLDHVRTFIHLVNKGYLLELTDDERVIRGQLVQSLRADFGFLNQMIGQTAIEVNWSRWSMKDYRTIVLKMRGLQATLIAAYSGLISGEENHSVETFKERFLPNSVDEFRRLRKDICLTMGEIMQELATEPLNLQRPGYSDYKDVEKAEPAQTQSIVSAEDDDEVDHEQVLEEVGKRLQQEAADADNGSTESQTMVESATPAATAAETPVGAPTPHGPTVVERRLFAHGERMNNSDPNLPTYRTTAVKNLRNDFDAFAKKQLDLIANLLVSGGLSNVSKDTLNVNQPMTSMSEAWGRDHKRGVQEALVKDGGPVAFGIRPRRTRTGHTTTAMLDSPTAMPTAMPTAHSPIQEKNLESDDEDEEDEDAIVTGQGLVRVYSLLFSMNRFITEVQGLHSHVTMTRTGAKRHKRLHIHVWESLGKPDRKKAAAADGTADTEEDMCLQDALAELEGRTYKPKKITVIQHLLTIEQWFRSPSSIYAFKVMLALCVFAVLIWAPLPRPWFISYALTSAMPTIVIALTPTLGQSLFSFTFQVLGSAIGNIAGMIILEIFRDVGGYAFNPYGIVCLMALYAVPGAYLVQEKPALFVLGLLAMNGAGVLIITEYIQQVYNGATTFDSPPYRAGKGLAALAIALALVFCFQLLILRNPARHTLRKAIARLLETHLAYLTMLQAYCRALGPINPDERPPKKVVLKVESELKRREANLQAQIIGLNPLIMFAAAEPQWETPFRGDAASKILRANQILLDRWSEARTAIGSEPFPEFISREFISVLSPYRRQSNVLTKTSLYLAAASMASKIPLPLEIPKPGRLVSDLVQDALFLSSRFAKTEEGQESVKSGEFARYWFFLLVMTSACRQIETVEEGCRIIYGSFEDNL